MSVAETSIGLAGWAAGLVFAAHSPIVERECATRCASACLLGCLAYNAAWFPPYPQLLLHIALTSYFSFISVVIGAYCFEKCVDQPWGLPLFALFILEICCHIVRAFSLIEFYLYTVTINAIGYLQIFIFICIGGRGVRDRLFNLASRLWHGVSSYKATQGQETR